MTDLGGLHNTDWSDAIAITNSGFILGDSRATAEWWASPSRAVLWTLRSGT